MLRFLRKYSNSTGIKILYGLLAGLFIVWGVGAVGGRRMEVVARVDGQGSSRRDGEVAERYRLDHAQMNLSYVRVPAAAEEKRISLTDDDLTKYLQEHSDRYRVPAKVRAHYVAYRRADFLAQADVPESAIGDYYE